MQRLFLSGSRSFEIPCHYLFPVLKTILLLDYYYDNFGRGRDGGEKKERVRSMTPGRARGNFTTPDEIHGLPTWETGPE
jgi:hypothetical protein